MFVAAESLPSSRPKWRDRVLSEGAGYNLCKTSAFGGAKYGSLRTTDGARSLDSARDDRLGTAPKGEVEILETMPSLK